jgi:hypothetical protein
MRLRIEAVTALGCLGLFLGVASDNTPVGEGVLLVLMNTMTDGLNTSTVKLKKRILYVAEAT